MRTIITFLSMIVTSSLLYSQSSIVFDAGTDIDVGTGADVSAGTITVNGTSSGDGTFNNGPLPVELVVFNAIIVKNKVELKWQTSTEVNNYGFEVERQPLLSRGKGEVDSLFGLNIGNWQKIGFVNGNGNSNSLKNYSFIDKTVLSGKNSYRLKQIDNDGKYEYSKTIEVDLGTPKEFSLSQNYPNPFNPTTSIQYSVISNQNVILKVFDVLGNEVATLVDEEKQSGNYEVSFNTQQNTNNGQLSSGIYFYQLRTGDFVQEKKMVVLK